MGSWISRRFWSLLLARVRVGSVTLSLPGGETLQATGSTMGPEARLNLRSPSAVMRKLITGGGLGFAESYIAGEWDTDDLATTLEVAGRNIDSYVRNRRRSRVIEPTRRLWHRLARRRSREIDSIDVHYNLGNDFYEAWLDSTMTYSAAVFTSSDEDLESAQQEKYRRLAALAQLTADDHVLEIGCGWGGFAEYAATQIGCRVTGLTLSSEQAAYARNRLQRAGVDDRTNIKLLDFREETGSYDKVVSIEMIESIPADLWPPLFSTISRVLRPGGRVAMQAITIAEDLFDSLLRREDFISKHIFPGGALPSVDALDRLARNNDLELTETASYGKSYAATLRRWQIRFEEMWPQIARPRFDERFRRTWRYYLAYCEAGFNIGRIDVHQIEFAG
ncbi:MAG: cyclopropane-fatty-acyl-phospholipid synthase family protein [Acidimicrobiia bacterium]|nr:cyclopropane-fatty-acyl-phospholipid synthase family protein [Acidimicrobiia bacterium]